MHVDPSDLVASYCAANPVLNSFGTAVCADGGGVEILIDQNNGETMYQYNATGQLEAVLEVDPSGACIAGPSTFDIPSSCVSDLVAYGCGGTVFGGGIAVDETSVYWTTQVPGGAPGAVMKVALDGGVPTMLVADTPDALPQALTVDATAVYWVDGDALKRYAPK